jgi:CheY-like chemotaxis protein
MITTSQRHTIQASDKSQSGYFPNSFMLESPAPPPTPPCSPSPDHISSEFAVISTSANGASRNQTRESFSSPLSGRFRTLIVDDNPVNLSILERTLTIHFSHLVSPDIALARSGDAALSQLNSPTFAPSPPQGVSHIATPLTPTKELFESSFDLILLDIDMPGISGVQVAEQIRNVHNDQATAIVAVTTSTQPEQQRTYEMAGMDGVVGKPIDLHILDRVVTRALLSRRTRGRPRTSSVPLLSKEIVCRALHVCDLDKQSPDQQRRPQTSVTSASTLHDTSFRRSSFPLSIGEIHQMQESASSSMPSSTGFRLAPVDDLSESLANVVLFESDIQYRVEETLSRATFNHSQ